MLVANKFESTFGGGGGVQCEWGDCHSGLAIVSEILSPYCSDGSLCLAGNFLKTSNAFRFYFCWKLRSWFRKFHRKFVNC